MSLSVIYSLKTENQKHFLLHGPFLAQAMKNKYIHMLIQLKFIINNAFYFSL